MLRLSLVMNSPMARGGVVDTTKPSSCSAPKCARKSAHSLVSITVDMSKGAPSAIKEIFAIIQNVAPSPKNLVHS